MYSNSNLALRRLLESVKQTLQETKMFYKSF